MTAADGRLELRVGIDARLTPGLSGGLEQVVIGLAYGLSQLEQNGEEYVFLTRKAEDDWLHPYLGGRCRSLVSTVTGEEGPRTVALKRRLARLTRLARKAPAIPGLRRPGPHRSDGTIEAAGIDVMHFTIQDAFLTDLPTIYQPHDLQHLHLPRFFTPRERDHRERTYPVHCRRATAVVAMTRWGKKDLIHHYDLPPEKIYVIPWAPVLDAYEEPSSELVEQVSVRYRLPDRFAFYPAKTYPHKNHLALLDAIALLRRQGIRVPLICTGGVTDLHSRIRSKIADLDIADQVRLLGYISPTEVHVLYRRAHCLVFPSLFEGWGMPICEAFVSGLPVACSDIPVLEELADDAAIFFDPSDTEAIADAIRTVWEDEPLRQALRKKGHRRLQGVSWQETALKFRALYRSVAGQTLTAEDQRSLKSLS